MFAFDDLNGKDGGEVHRLLNDLATGKDAAKKAKKRKRGSKREENKKEAEGPQGAKPKAVDENKGLVTKEERNVGAVASTVYKKYMVAGGGYLKFSLVYFGFILSAANGLATVSWVSYWTTDATYEKHSQEFYLGLYALFACK